MGTKWLHLKLIAQEQKKLQEEAKELHEALRDLEYEFLKSIGFIWLIKKIPFLKLKDWVKERDSE